MLKLISIAFKNIFRNKRRTIITEVSIIVGMIVLVFVCGLIKDLEYSWRDDIINMNLGHVQVMAKGLKEEDSLKFSIKDKNQIIEKLNNNKSIVSYTSRINVSGLLSTGEETKIFIGMGVNPENELKTLSMAANKLKEGTYVINDEMDSAVIGSGLAEKMQIKIGDNIMLATNDKYGALNAVDISIVGIITVEETFVNNHLVIMHIDNARLLTSYDKNEVSRLVFAINKTENAILEKENFEKVLSDDEVEVFSWHSLAGEFNGVIAIFSSISLVLTIILLVLVLVGIMNTILMSVFERKQEIGTLMAIGSSPSQTLLIFLFESFFIGLFGVIIGSLSGMLIVTIVNLLGGISFPPPPGATEGFTLKPIILMDKVAINFLMVLITAVLAGIYPAKYATKQRPVDALRNV